MLVAAVMVGVLGHLLFPRILVWLLFVMLVWERERSGFARLTFETDRSTVGRPNRFNAMGRAVWNQESPTTGPRS